MSALCQHRSDCLVVTTTEQSWSASRQTQMGGLLQHVFQCRWPVQRDFHLTHPYHQLLHADTPATAPPLIAAGTHHNTSNGSSLWRHTSHKSSATNFPYTQASTNLCTLQTQHAADNNSSSSNKQQQQPPTTAPINPQSRAQQASLPHGYVVAPCQHAPAAPHSHS